MNEKIYSKLKFIKLSATESKQTTVHTVGAISKIGNIYHVLLGAS